MTFTIYCAYMGQKAKEKERGEAKTENKRVRQQKHEKNGGGDLQRRATCCVMSIEIEKKKKEANTKRRCWETRSGAAMIY